MKRQPSATSAYIPVNPLAPSMTGDERGDVCREFRKFGPILLAFVWLVQSSWGAEIALTFGTYTSKKPTEMVKLYRPMLSAIEASMTEKLKVPVKIQILVAKTYEEGIESIVSGSCDFMQIGPASYVVAKQQKPEVEILVVEGLKGQKIVNGIICVGSNVPIHNIGELKGHSVAFGDKYSTTGRYNSQLFLLENGIKARDLSRFSYLERHDRVGAAVAAGEYDAAR